MNNTAEIIEFNKGGIRFDDITCILNPLQIRDLKEILLMTREDRRLDIALVFSGLSLIELGKKSGLVNNEKDMTIYRWVNHSNKLPLGAAFRLAKVFGISSEILFADPKWFDK